MLAAVTQRGIRAVWCDSAPSVGTTVHERLQTRMSILIAKLQHVHSFFLQMETRHAINVQTQASDIKIYTFNQGCGAVTFLVGSGSGSGSGEAFRLRLRLRLRVKLFGSSGSGSGSGKNVPAPAAPAPAPMTKSSYEP